MMEIETAFPPASEANIQQLQPFFKGLLLPVEYRNFLMQHNGCTVLMFNQRRPKGWPLRFLSVSDVIKDSPMIEDLYYNNGEPQAPDSFPHVPIATDDNSNYLAYELRRPQRNSFQICLVDREDYPFADDEEDITLFKRAENLEDLIDQLQRGVFASF